jgi:hypothetical protein
MPYELKHDFNMLPLMVERTWKNINDSFERLSDKLERQAEDQKQRARVTNKLRSFMKTVDPENASAYDLMGPDELDGRGLAYSDKARKAKDDQTKLMQEAEMQRMQKASALDQAQIDRIMATDARQRAVQKRAGELMMPRTTTWTGQPVTPGALDLNLRTDGAPTNYLNQQGTDEQPPDMPSATVVPAMSPAEALMRAKLELNDVDATDMTRLMDERNQSVFKGDEIGVPRAMGSGANFVPTSRNAGQVFFDNTRPLNPKDEANVENIQARTSRLGKVQLISRGTGPNGEDVATWVTPEELDAMRTTQPKPSTDKVLIEKDGKRYWLPASQLEQAKREGWTHIPTQ